MTSPLRVALVGNPNSGKSTLFNALTGGRQHIGNYPGVTVAKKEGAACWDGRDVVLVDLPGIYSLTAYSQEERVARSYLLDERPDVVVDILDAVNLERNLYLAVQLMELGVPLLLVLNKSDLAQALGISFDLPRLAQLLDAPLVVTVGHKGEGLADLQRSILEVGRTRARPAPALSYGREVDAATAEIAAALPAADGAPPPRWTALKLLENDSLVRAGAPAALQAVVAARQQQLRTLFGDGPEIVIADRRYGFISGACQEAVRSTVEDRHTRSDQIDAFLTHPVLGLPFFFVLMYLVFWLTFTLGSPMVAGLQWGFDHLAAVLPAGGAWGSLLVDGVVRGVGGVLQFLPNILLLFAAIAILEDSGYMARAAFITDRYMHRVGLHGKSFIPMLLGFGCSVPAIMATRMLDSRRDRLATMMVLPLISCAARLPVFTLLISAFFPGPWQAVVLWGVYLLGIGLALVLARLLRHTLFRGETTPLVMELPPYRMPTFRLVFAHMGERAGEYLKRAGSFILVAALILWALNYFPAPTPGSLEPAPSSWSARIGHAMEPVLRPMGFDGRIGTALLSALAGRELFITQLGIALATDRPAGAPGDLVTALRREYPPLVGLGVILFMLIGLPCVGTLAAVRMESGSWGWALLQFAGLTVLAWTAATVLYQVGRILLPGS